LKRLADQTLYEILEIRADAAAAEIGSACERAAALYGPGSLATYSLMAPEEAELLTRRIEEARATLLDPDARARYDEELKRRPPEARAAAAGGAQREPPPIIPAMQLPPLAAAEEDEDAGEALTPLPLPLATVAEAPVRDAREADVRPAPIPLSREIRHAAEAPAHTPPPLPSRPAATAPAVVEGGPWTGEALRQVRDARGLSVQQIAERTKVTRHHIENIEADRFGALPAPVYLRGILLALARELRLDGQKVARSYLERVAGAKPR
jgi:curved DNA-binding protein CbpA